MHARPARGSEYCYGCKPRLTYSGGPVINTLGPRGLTVTPIYWAPPGPKNQIPAGYQSRTPGAGRSPE